VAERVAVGLLDRRARGRADVREEHVRLDVRGELTQVDVAPGGRDAVVDGRPHALAVPAHPEAVAVGRLDAHARVQALVDEAVLGFEQHPPDDPRLTCPPPPPPQGAIVGAVGGPEAPPRGGGPLPPPVPERRLMASAPAETGWPQS